MTFPRRTARFIASLGILLAGAVAIYTTRGALEQDVTGTAEVIDGDSIRISGQEIRLRGIDAPEYNQTCEISGKDSPCGRDARAHLRRLTSTGLVTCVGSERDRYGRMLAVCRVRGIDLNATMVRDGHAVSYGAYGAEEADAKSAYRGIWSGTFERPQDWRRRHNPGQR